MFALRERRMHVTQEDFEMAVSKVMKKVGAGTVGGSVGEGWYWRWGSRGARQCVLGGACCNVWGSLL